jgi:hypothetical protein
MIKERDMSKLVELGLKRDALKYRPLDGRDLDQIILRARDHLSLSLAFRAEGEIAESRAQALLAKGALSLNKIIYQQCVDEYQRACRLAM